MYTVRKKFTFEAAHALTTSFSKDCQQIHGHSYIVELFFSSEGLNSDGMVIDFGEVKELVQPLIKKWDHLLLIEMDSNIGQGFSDIGQGLMTPLQLRVGFVPFNPTAENMAKFLYDAIKPRMYLLTKVRIHETESGWAEFYEK